MFRLLVEVLLTPEEDFFMFSEIIMRHFHTASFFAVATNRSAFDVALLACVSQSSTFNLAITSAASVEEQEVCLKQHKHLFMLLPSSVS